MEGLPKDEKRPEETEDFIESYNHASEHVPTENVETVVAALNEALRDCRANPDMTCDCDAMHARICQTEVKELYEKYEKHQILTIEDIELSVNTVMNALDKVLEEDGEDEYISERKAILSTRATEIERATRRYIRTISKFDTIKKQQFRMDVEEFKMAFQEADQVRRNAHNGLIEAVTVYTRSINELKEYGALDDIEVEEWRLGDMYMGDVIQEGKVFVFSGEILRDRDLVRDWAVSANMCNTLHQLEEIVAGKENDA